jgi:hypothetical protein
MNIQGWRLIIALVQVGAMNIYVAQWRRSRKRKERMKLSLLPKLIVFLTVLYVGQCPWSGGITEVQSPSAPPQEGPYFSNAALLGALPYTKAPNQRLFHSALRKTQEPWFL